MSLSPASLWSAKPTGVQPSSHSFNCNGRFFGNFTDVQDQPPVVWAGGLREQTYDGRDLGNHPILEPASSRSSQQQLDTHADPDDSHSESMPNMAVNSLKRARSPHAPAICSLGLRSCSLPSNSDTNLSSTPWRKSMRRGFLLSAATSCSEDDGGPSAACAPVEAQVFFISQNQHSQFVEPAMHDVIQYLQ